MICRIPISTLILPPKNLLELEIQTSKLIITSNLTVTLLPCKRPLFSFCLLEGGGERDVLPELHQAFDVAKSRTSLLVNLVFSCQTGFPSSIIGLLIEPNPMYHATAILGLGSELYPSNIQHSVCSTKILLDSFILENAKIEQVKQRLC